MRIYLAALGPLVGLVALMTPSASATDYYVNGDTGNDDWDGLCEVWDGGTCGPKRTIQAGIDVTSDGDTVWVADGTYTGPGNKNLDYNGKGITVCSKDGPGNCIIDCEQDGRGLYFHNGETAEAIVTGLTITNAAAGSYGWGGGIACEGSSPMIRNCTLAANCTDYLGGGVSCMYGSPWIINCHFVSNSAAGHGGGISCFESNATISNCTFNNNYAGSDGGGGGGLYYWNCTATVTSCILWGNTQPEISINGGYADTDHCVAQGGWPGSGNIDADPLFVDTDGPDEDPETWEDNDYHLALGSPCIDAGDPAFVAEPGVTDIDDQMRIWDGDGEGITCVDMGADEFGSFRYGDLNCDGAIDGFDIDAFLLVVGDSYPFDDYYNVYPDCDHELADINTDGVADGFDIDAFVMLLLDP